MVLCSGHSDRYLIRWQLLYFYKSITVRTLEPCTLDIFCAFRLWLHINEKPETARDPVTTKQLSTVVILLYQFIVNWGDWLWSLANIKGANKDAKIYVGRSKTQQNLLFCANTLCMSYVINTFLLVDSLVRSKQLLCFVQDQGQKSEQKHTTKTFDEFHNHSSL